MNICSHGRNLKDNCPYCFTLAETVSRQVSQFNLDNRLVWQGPKRDRGIPTKKNVPSEKTGRIVLMILLLMVAAFGFAVAMLVIK